jgi:hypothetical protein
MVRAHSPFYGRRFVGDTGKNLVHDLLFEKAGCAIERIDHNCLRTFNPDTQDQARSENYKPCKYCLIFDVPFPG